MTLCGALLRLLEDPKAPFQLYLIVFRLMSYRTSTAAVPSEGEQLLVECFQDIAR